MIKACRSSEIHKLQIQFKLCWSQSPSSKIKPVLLKPVCCIYIISSAARSIIKQLLVPLIESQTCHWLGVSNALLKVTKTFGKVVSNQSNTNRVLQTCLTLTILAWSEDVRKQILINFLIDFFTFLPTLLTFNRLLIESCRLTAFTLDLVKLCVISQKILSQNNVWGFKQGD